MFNKEVYIGRRKRLMSSINDGIILLLGNNDSPMNYPANTYHFRQDSSFLYFLGLDAQGLACVMDVDQDEVVLFGDDVEIDDIIWMGSQASIASKAIESGIPKTSTFNKLGETINKAIRLGRKIHFLPSYRMQNTILLESLLGINHINIKNYISPELVKAVIELRSVKDEFEIAEITRACEIGYEMHTAAMKMAKPGLIESDIAGYIEGIALSKGAGVSFPVILSISGEILHNHNHGNILKDGDLLLTDAGAESNMHYASDFTRTFPVNGRFSQKQREIYQIVLDANNTAMSSVKAGIKYKDVHIKVAGVITKGLMELGLMKGNIEDAVRNGAHTLFFPHGLGHMMGLDVHDMEDLGENNVGYDENTKRSDQFGTAYLRLGKELKSGYVITNEPGIYFIPALIDKWKAEKINTSFINFEKVNDYRGFGGIRLEDDLLVTDKGCRMFSKRIPITINEIEEFMLR